MSTFGSAGIALFPLASVLFPGQQLRLHLFEQRYLDLMRDRGELDPIFGVVLIRSGSEVGKAPEIFPVGTAARLDVGVRHEDGRYSLTVEGARRFRVRSLDWSRGYAMASVDWLDPEAPERGKFDVDLVRDEFAFYVLELSERLGDTAGPEALASRLRAELSGEPRLVLWRIATQLPLNSWHLQELLEIEEADRLVERLRMVIERERRRLSVAGPTSGSFPNTRTVSPN